MFASVSFKIYINHNLRLGILNTIYKSLYSSDELYCVQLVGWQKFMECSAKSQRITTIAELKRRHVFPGDLGINFRNYWRSLTR